MIIDTHRAIEKLLSAGNSKENSEVIVDLINSQEDHLATKGDVFRLENEIEKIQIKIDIEFKWMRILMIAVLGLLIKISFFST